MWAWKTWSFESLTREKLGELGAWTSEVTNLESLEHEHLKFKELHRLLQDKTCTHSSFFCLFVCFWAHVGKGALLPAIGNSEGDLAPCFLFFILFFFVFLSVARWGSFTFHHRQQRGSFNSPTSSFFFFVFSRAFKCNWVYHCQQRGNFGSPFLFFLYAFGCNWACQCQ